MTSQEEATKACDEEFSSHLTDDAVATLRSTLESRIVDREFCLENSASRPLNITCYGSSSSKTPERYLEEARLLGYILSRRGHVCINGAGSYGCMAAMNDGVYAGEGHVRGVIHEMFLADNGYFDVDAKTQERLMRRGSSHRVFDNALLLNREEQNQRDKLETKEDAVRRTSTATTPIREMLVAGGPDLQERKKFLVADTDALIVLPGGPGTWDELWEMACARHLKLNTLPIVCVNVDGYYEPFRMMLQRAYADKLIHLPPDDIVRFASGAEDAMRFVEGHKISNNSNAAVHVVDQEKAKDTFRSSWQTLALTFVAGAVLGIAMTKTRGGR